MQRKGKSDACRYEKTLICMKTSMRWDEIEGAMDLLFLCSYEKPFNLH